MNEGYCKLHRKLFNSELWLKEPFTKGQAWIDLFANANFKDSSFQIRGNTINVKRGQLGWSEITMAKRWMWSRNKVRRFLEYLETEQQIVKTLYKNNGKTIQQTEQQNLSKITTIITILNYDKYQQTEQQNSKNDTTDDTTDGTHRIKNINKERREEERKSLSKEKIWEIAKKYKVTFNDVNSKHQDVLDHIEADDKYGKAVVSVNLTTQNWLRRDIDRGYIQKLDGIEWEVEMDDHEPSRIEKREKAKLKIKEDEKNGKPIFDFTKFRKQ